MRPCGCASVVLAGPVSLSHGASPSSQVSPVDPVSVDCVQTEVKYVANGRGWSWRRAHENEFNDCNFLYSRVFFVCLTWLLCFCRTAVLRTTVFVGFTAHCSLERGCFCAGQTF